MPRIQKGTVVRLVKDSTGDLAKRYIGKKGIVQRKATKKELGVTTGFAVKFEGRKEPLFLYRSEIEIVEK